MGKWYLRCNRRIFPPTNRYLPIKVSVAGALSLARHLACVGVQQELDIKRPIMIATLKQHYEYYHAGDLTALKKLSRVVSRFVLELGDAISGISRVPSQAARSIG